MISDAEYQSFVVAVRELADDMKRYDVSDFALTREEKAAIAALPEDIVKEVESILAQYTPGEGLDIRAELVWKGLAGVLLNLPKLEKAITLGTEIGGELV